MLPIITPEICEETVNAILNDIKVWRKNMIHYIKDENPELNTAIVEMAQKTELDPHALATGAYMTYMLLEKSPDNFMSDLEDEEE